MTIIGPGDTVAVKPRTPPVYSLVSLANDPKDPDERWVNGIVYRPEPCDNSGVFDPCNRGTKAGGQDDDTRPPEIKHQPHGVYAHASCFTFSQNRVRGLRDEAERALRARESKQIAREFQDGVFAQAGGYTDNIWLRKAGATLLSTSAGVGAVAALACLEQAAADLAPGRAMIHCTAQVFTEWLNAYLVETDGRTSYTHLGTIVVPDDGYTGASPTGVADVSGVSWAYATDVVDVRRGSITILPDSLAEAINRETNEVIYRAERPAAATFDGCLRAAVGVQVTPCLAIQGAS